MSWGTATAPYELAYKILQHEAFSRAHAGHVIAQGIFFGLGQMQGLGLQHLRGMGFIMARLEAPDGLPVFSGPSYIEICSARAGVGAGIYTGASLLILSVPRCTQNRSAGAGVGTASHLGIPCAKASASLNVPYAKLLERTAELDSVIVAFTGLSSLSYYNMALCECRCCSRCCDLHVSA